ncbi:FHA domain-containing protein [Phormidesmis priestleyi]
MGFLVSMVTKNSPLLTHLQDLKNLITNDLDQDHFFQQASQKLDEVVSDLESEKLTVHLLSSDLDLAKSFHNFLNSYQDLKTHYQIQLQELSNPSPRKINVAPPAFLVLQQLQNLEATQQNRHELLYDRLLVVGRKPGCEISIPDHYTRVSGRHLEVQSCLSTNGHRLIPTWWIQNSDGCRNGTYLNGELLTERQVLKHGDRLVLGNQFSTSKSPELRFECQSALDEPAIQSDEHQTLQKFMSCDVLFLVVDAHRELLQEERQFLEAASAVLTCQVFLVALQTEIVEIFPVSQSPKPPISIEDLSQQITPNSKKQIEFKKQRILFQIVAIVESISKTLLNKHQAVKQEIERIESQQNSNQQNLRSSRKEATGDVSFLLKSINDQKAILLKSVEAAIAHSKRDLLDDSLSNSILQKIQDVVEQLEGYVVKQGNDKHLELRVIGSDLNVNEFIVQFCENELLNWASQEWQKICEEYGNGGLKGLVRSSNKILKPIVEKNGKKLSIQIKTTIEFDGIFQASLRRIPCKVEYEEKPIWAYFIHKIRSSMFQVMGLLFLLSFLGYSRSNLIKLINRYISGSIFLSALVFGVVIWLIHKLYKQYQKDKRAEINKALEKRREELRNYYQRVIKGRFVEQLSQSLETTFRREVDGFDETIRSFLEIAGKDSSETQNSLLDLRTYLRDCQTRSSELGRKLRDLQRIKDKLQRL